MVNVYWWVRNLRTGKVVKEKRRVVMAPETEGSRTFSIGLFQTMSRERRMDGTWFGGGVIIMGTRSVPRDVKERKAAKRLLKKEVVGELSTAFSEMKDRLEQEMDDEIIE